jgi:hypothetical protein
MISRHIVEKGSSEPNVTLALTPQRIHPCSTYSLVSGAEETRATSMWTFAKPMSARSAVITMKLSPQQLTRKEVNMRPIKISPRLQHTLNRILSRNIGRLDVSPKQRAALAVLLLEPSISAEGRKRRFNAPRKK